MHPFRENLSATLVIRENANQITGDHLPHIRLIILHSFIHSLGERVRGGIKREDKKKN